MTTGSPILVLRGVSKQYGDGERMVWALRNITLSVYPNEFVAITGPSGSGKSTLLNLIAGLDEPSSGEVEIEGRLLSSLSDNELARVRRCTVAYVFQFFNLLPTLTAAQNVAVSLRAEGLAVAEIRARVDRRLEQVGLTARAHHYPNQLSGGEMQRVAIARALSTDARVILADEPTGNLDSSRGEEILELLYRSVESDHRTVVLVTHDLRSAAYGDRLITMRDGQFVDEIVQTPSETVTLVPTRRR